MSLPQLYLVLLLAGVTLLVSIAVMRVGSRIGLPALLMFLAVGVTLGEDVIGIDFDDTRLAQNLGTVALALILVDGGLTTRWRDVHRILMPAGVLASIGVFVSVLITALGAHLILGFDWQLAFLLGAIISSTDAAAVFSVLRNLPVPRRISGMLEAESGFNDAPTVILVLALSTASGTLPGPGGLLVDLVYQLSVGAAIGMAVGWLGALAARRLALPASGLYPLVAVGLGVVAFGAAGSASASGFIAAYLASMILGNAQLPHRAATRSFAEGIGWMAQIGLFVMLGMLATPSELADDLLPALAIGLVLLLVARPMSVVVSLTPFGVPWREQTLVSWAGLRGAVPVVLATIPVVEEVPDSTTLLNIVFVLVAAFTLVQGPTLPAMARLLRLAAPGQPRDVEIESAPLDLLEAEQLTVAIPPKSKLHGLQVFELRLPEHSVINSVIRDGVLFVPDGDTRLFVGDELLIVTMADTRAATEARLRALGRRGRLARWFGEDGGDE